MVVRSNHVCVLVAMPSELQHMVGMPTSVDNQDTPWQSTTWQLETLEITAILTGMGMIRAAAATEYAVGTFDPRAILNYGCAGAHRRDVNLGDVIVGTRYVAHSSSVLTAAGVTRYDLHNGQDAPSPGATGIPADPSLLEIAHRVAMPWSPDPWLRAGGTAHSPVVRKGVIASADVWTQAPDAIDQLAERHHSLCEDMEAAAIAKICSLHAIPFLAVKDISNNELQSVTVFDPDQAHLPADEVGRRAASLVNLILDDIAGLGVATD